MLFNQYLNPTNTKPVKGKEILKKKKKEEKENTKSKKIDTKVHKKLKCSMPLEIRQSSNINKPNNIKQNRRGRLCG